jgi:hypothetical protein
MSPYQGGVRVKKGPRATPYTVGMSFPQDVHAYMRTHAFVRDVSEQELIRDILRSWIRRATPQRDPRFSVHSIGYPLPGPPSDEETTYCSRKYPGYVATLCFSPEAEVTPPDGNEPPPRTKTELWPGSDVE